MVEGMNELYRAAEREGKISSAVPQRISGTHGRTTPCCCNSRGTLYPPVPALDLAASEKQCRMVLGLETSKVSEGANHTLAAGGYPLPALRNGETITRLKAESSGWTPYPPLAFVL